MFRKLTMASIGLAFLGMVWLHHPTQMTDAAKVAVIGLKVGALKVWELTAGAAPGAAKSLNKPALLSPNSPPENVTPLNAN